jgi:hypothetical protein
MIEQRYTPPPEISSQGRLKRARSFMRRHPAGFAGGTIGGLAVEQAATGGMFTANLATLSFILLAKESVSVVVQTRDKYKNAPYGSLSTKGFRTSPNPSAEKLADYTDIPFTPPGKIVYDVRNQITHLRKDPLGALLTRRRLRGDTLAMYENGYNAIFTDENINVVEEIHENAHSLINQINPNISRVRQEFTRAFIREIPRVDTEKPMVFSSFSEGMAQWLSLYTAERLYYDMRDAQTSTDHLEEALLKFVSRNLVTAIRNNEGGRSLIFTAFNPPNVKDVATIREAISIVDHAFSISEGGARFAIRNFRFLEQADHILDTVQYDMGAHFVNEGIIRLVRSGMSIKEAIIALIENPPETVDNLIHPGIYVREKFSSEPGSS